MALATLSFVICVAVDPAVAQRRGGGTARLTLTRTTDMLYLGAAAFVSVDGKKVATLWRGESATVTIPAGPNRVAVDAFLQPGSFVVVVNARPGGHYAMEISPRGESYIPGAVFGLAGAVIDAAANENKAGAFKMRLVK